jgi:hypothetical protein
MEISREKTEIARKITNHDYITPGFPILKEFVQNFIQIYGELFVLQNDQIFF